MPLLHDLHELGHVQLTQLLLLVHNVFLLLLPHGLLLLERPHVRLAALLAGRLLSHAILP